MDTNRESAKQHFTGSKTHRASVWVHFLRYLESITDKFVQRIKLIEAFKYNLVSESVVPDVGWLNKP